MPEHDDQDEQTPEPSLVESELQHELPAVGRARAVRRRRLIQLAISIGLAASVFVVVLLATGSGTSSPPPRPGSARALTIEQEIGALLAGIPQSRNVLGKPTAPVTLRWFGDMECPFCREYTLGALPLIVRRWVRGGQLRIEYRSLDSATRQPKVFEAQEIAALAAGAQNKMWYFLETFFHEQGAEGSGYVTEKFLRGIARQVPGLNMSKWLQERHDPQLLAQLAQDELIAGRAHFTGTPSFLIGRTGGAVRSFSPGSNVNSAPFDKAIEDLLKSRVPGSPRAIPAVVLS